MVAAVAWSYSALTAFETCPRRFYLTRIAKVVVEPESEAIKWGNRVHQAIEAYLLTGAPLPTNVAQYQGVVDRIKAKGATPGAELHAERKIALTQDFKPTTFFGKGVWVRGVLDASIVLPNGKMLIADWKTGKPKPDSDQLRLFAALGMALHPEVEEVTTAFVWLAAGKLDTDRFTRDDVPAIWQGFLPRVQRMEHAAAETKYPPKPSGLCRAWCPVGKARCDFCGS